MDRKMSLPLRSAVYKMREGSKRNIRTLPAASFADVQRLCIPTLHADLAQLANELGPVFRIPFGDQPALVVGDADLAEHLLSPRRAGRAFRHRWEDTDFFPFAKFGHLLGASQSATKTAGIFFGNGPHHWEPARRAAEKGFVQGRSTREAGEAAASAAAAALCNAWLDRGDGLFDVSIDIREATLDVVVRVAFGGDDVLSTEASKELRAIYTTMTTAFEAVLGVPPKTWWLVRPRQLRELQEAAERLKVLLVPTLKQRASQSARSSRRCIVDVLLDAGIPDGAVLMNALQILGAGHDTTATSLILLLWHLAQDPELQEAIRHELQNGDVEGGEQWPLLTASIRELLRMWPAAPLIIRQSCEPVPSWQSLTIPDGTIAIVAPWLLGRSMELWGDPQNFRPARFIDDPVSGGAAHKFAWIPFGYGMRNCVGQHLALAELKAFSAALLQRFRFAADDPPTAEWFLTLRLRDGLRLHVERVV